MALTVLPGGVVALLLAVTTIFAGIMAGLFFAYSVSVVLALDTLSGAAYTTVMQSINEKILNPVFGVAFAGAAIVPAVSTAIALLRGDWMEPYGQLLLAGFVVYLVGTVAVTMVIHIPINEYIATWSSASPADDWTTVRARWTLWNHVRTAASVISFMLYLAALVEVS